jgi:hypothetical protein
MELVHLSVADYQNTQGVPFRFLERGIRGGIFLCSFDHTLKSPLHTHAKTQRRTAGGGALSELQADTGAGLQ